jgi:hypothetical protein
MIGTPNQPIETILLKNKNIFRISKYKKELKISTGATEFLA